MTKTFLILILCLVNSIAFNQAKLTYSYLNSGAELNNSVSDTLTISELDSLRFGIEEKSKSPKGKIDEIYISTSIFSLLTSKGNRISRSSLKFIHQNHEKEFKIDSILISYEDGRDQILSVSKEFHIKEELNGNECYWYKRSLFSFYTIITGRASSSIQIVNDSLIDFSFSKKEECYFVDFGDWGPDYRVEIKSGDDLIWYYSFEGSDKDEAANSTFQIQCDASYEIKVIGEVFYYAELGETDQTYFLQCICKE